MWLWNIDRGPDRLIARRTVAKYCIRFIISPLLLLIESAFQPQFSLWCCNFKRKKKKLNDNYDLLQLLHASPLKKQNKAVSYIQPMLSAHLLSFPSSLFKPIISLFPPFFHWCTITSDSVVAWCWILLKMGVASFWLPFKTLKSCLAVTWVILVAIKVNVLVGRCTAIVVLTVLNNNTVRSTVLS